MRKALAIAAVSGFSACLMAIGAGPASAEANQRDTAFMMANAQTNLAEITIGQIAEQRAQYPSTKELAAKTMADHQAAMAKLMTVAKNLTVTLPSTPNAEQQAAAAKLKSVDTSSFDVTYDQIQVQGHQASIADTNNELSAGSDQTVKDYAQFYLPVANMHLAMAQADLAAVTSSDPYAVPAGSGGAAATTSAGTRALQTGAGIAGAGLAALGAAGAVRRRKAAR